MRGIIHPRFIQLIVAAAAVLGCAAPLVGQAVIGGAGTNVLSTSPPPAPAVPLNGQTGAVLGAASCNAKPYKRQPYTVQFKITNVQTLADGTTITRETTQTMAVDSAGRRMNSSTSSPTDEGQPAFTYGNVNDPVDGTQINWNSQTKKATVIQLRPADERQGCWLSDDGRMSMNYGPYPSRNQAAAGSHLGSGISVAISSMPPGIIPRDIEKPVTEDLGTISIMGVEAHGQRTTWTTPAGAIGNDRPLVRTSEIWMARSLGLVLREVTDDPRMGKTTREVTSLDLGEPPMSIFQPPDGYDVVTETLHQVDCQQQIQ